MIGMSGQQDDFQFFQIEEIQKQGVKIGDKELKGQLEQSTNKVNNIDEQQVKQSGIIKKESLQSIMIDKISSQTIGGSNRRGEGRRLVRKQNDVQKIEQIDSVLNEQVKDTLKLEVCQVKVEQNEMLKSSSQNITDIRGSQKKVLSAEQKLIEKTFINLNQESLQKILHNSQQAVRQTENPIDQLLISSIINKQAKPEKDQKQQKTSKQIQDREQERHFDDNIMTRSITKPLVMTDSKKSQQRVVTSNHIVSNIDKINQNNNPFSNQQPSHTYSQQASLKSSVEPLQSEAVSILNSISSPIKQIDSLNQSKELRYSLNQPKLQQNIDVANPAGIDCSILQLSELSQVIQSSKFAISQLTSSTRNDDWKCQQLKSSKDSHSYVSLIRYYGFSSTEISTTNNNQKTTKYNRQLLLGTRSKLKKEIFEEEKILQSKVNKIKFYLYLQPNLSPIVKNSISISQASTIQPNFLHKLTFAERVNVVIDLLQVFALIHDSDFMLFPNVLFPQTVQKAILFAQRKQSKTQNSSKSTEFQSHLKIGVHYLQSFKHHMGNSSKLFNLKTFISQIAIPKLTAQKNQEDQDGQKGLTQRKQKEGKILRSTGLKSPQIRFYHEEWFWTVWNKTLQQYLQSQNNHNSISSIISPIWIDLFEITLECLKFLFDAQIIDKIIDSRYEQVIKNVGKIFTNDRIKNPMNSKQNTKILSPQSEQEIFKLCQKPLFEWKEYQSIFKQNQEKTSKNLQKDKAANLKHNSKSQDSTLISNPTSKKVFEQISSFLSILPFHKVSKQKYIPKRVLSLKTLLQKLSKFKSKQTPTSIVPALINTNQKSTQHLQKNKKNQTKQVNKNLPPVETKTLTLLSLQTANNSLASLKQKYLQLIHSQKGLTKQQFQLQYIKKPQTHLLTSELKKKINSIFSSHNGIMKTPKTYTLLYKSSPFNFSTKKFYEYCQNKQRLFIVLKVKDDKTIFYFTEEKILRQKQMNGLFGNFVKDTKGTSFIYTGDQVLKIKNPLCSFGVSHSYGPIIGEGDIVIKEGNIDNECNHPKSYEAMKKGKKLLKLPRFELQEMDVYEITF